jgi:hypothetical protein
MDREIYFFDQYRCYVVRWISDISRDGVIQHWEALIQDPRFQPGYAALHDARGRAPKASWSDLREGTERYRVAVEPRVGFGRVAILVDAEDVRAQALRLLELLELEGAIVTASEAEARSWVGLPLDLPLPYHA